MTRGTFLPLNEKASARPKSGQAAEEPIGAAPAKTGQLTKNSLNGGDICKMMKRRLRDVSLPSRLSPHSLRVTTITDLLEHGVPPEDVQRLAGLGVPRGPRDSMIAGRKRSPQRRGTNFDLEHFD